jgi:hypothetical protein
VLQIEEETEKARKRAERFGQEFSEPSVELILDPEETELYYKITQPDRYKRARQERMQYRSQVRHARSLYVVSSCSRCARVAENKFCMRFPAPNPPPPRPSCQTSHARTLIHILFTRSRSYQRIGGGLLDGPSQVRDREYTQRLLEKVAEAQRAARARAERFGVEYVEPKLSVILSREEYRKYMSATAGAICTRTLTCARWVAILMCLRR